MFVIRRSFDTAVMTIAIQLRKGFWSNRIKRQIKGTGEQESQQPGFKTNKELEIQ